MKYLEKYKDENIEEYLSLAKKYDCEKEFIEVVDSDELLGLDNVLDVQVLIKFYKEIDSLTSNLKIKQNLKFLNLTTEYENYQALGTFIKQKDKRVYAACNESTVEELAELFKTIYKKDFREFPQWKYIEKEYFNKKEK